MKKNIIKYSYLLVLLLLSSPSIFAQDVSAASANTTTFPLSINAILCIIAVLLLFIIIVLAMTISNAIELFKQKNGLLKNVSVLIGLMLMAQFSFAQEVSNAEAVANSTAITAISGQFYFYAFITVIIVEVAIILFFIRALSYLTGIDSYKKSQAKKNKSIWQLINQFKPIEEEDGMDTGHNYDGIRELDNVTPPWFTIGFAASILFALVYLYRFEIAHTALTQEEEYNAEVRVAKALQDSMLKLEGNKVDENTVAMLDASGIESGMKLFTSNCGACHGDKGQGGVGPNLTDAYWLHGGSIKDVFKSIKYGWQDKGMKAWKDDFSPTQIAQLSSYIESLKGSNPPNAKEKQGELYVETVELAAANTDSVKAK